MKGPLKYIGITLLLIVVGFFSKEYFDDLSMNQMDRNSIVLFSSFLGDSFLDKIILSFVFGSIPILYWLVDKLSKLKNSKQSLSVIGIIIFCGILAWQIRIFQLNFQMEKFSELFRANNIQNTMDYAKLNFGQFLFIGFLIGTVLSILIFRNKNNSEIK